jgi:capsular exopolysaccharide synthesis family protein
MTLRDYLSAARKYWWVILGAASLGALVGVLAVLRADPVYRAEVTFFVKTTGENTASAAAMGDQFAQRRVNSYVGLLASDRLADMVVRTSGLDLSTEEVSGMIGASGDINTVLLTATATSRSEEVASRVARAVALRFPGLVDSIENQSPDETAVTLEVVNGPIVAELPSRAPLKIGTPALLGLLLGFAIALLLQWRDTAVRSVEEVSHLGLGPVLGKVPFDRRIRTAPLILTDDPRSVRAEAFRQLRTNLQFLSVDEPIRVLVVTSSVADEGKSITSANLALTVAAADARVLVIEADLRKPSLADIFGVERAVGLTDVLAGRLDLDHVVQPWGDSGVTVLPSGPLPPNPAELLGSVAMGALLDRARESYDLVVIDTPPLLPVTDPAVLAARVDGAVLVARFGKTSRQQLTQARRALEAVGARQLGTVLTMVPPNKHDGYTPYRYETAPEETTATRVTWEADRPAVYPSEPAAGPEGRPAGPPTLGDRPHQHAVVITGDTRRTQEPVGMVTSQATEQPRGI